MHPEGILSSIQMFAPTPDQIAASRLSDFMRYCSDPSASVSFTDQAAFHKFSVTQQECFWRLLLSWARLPIEGDVETVCTDIFCEGAHFFPNVRLNYSESLLASDDTRAALTVCHDDAPTEHITLGELRRMLAKVAKEFRALGLSPGDRVAAIA